MKTVGPRPVAGVRTALRLQVVLNAVLAPLLYPILLSFFAMTGLPVVQIHDVTARCIWLTVPIAALHLLAALQVGRVPRGALYAAASLLAALVQVVVLMCSGPAGLMLAVLPIAAAIALALEVAKPGTRERLAAANGTSRRLLVESVVVTIAVAATAGLLAWNDSANDAEYRHPPADFDSSEVYERLDDAMSDGLEAIAGIEGMSETVNDGPDDQTCSLEDGWDYARTEYERWHTWEGLTPLEGPGLEALESLRDHLPEHGWEITHDERLSDSEHRLNAIRQDGTRLSFEFGEFTVLSVASGCVANVD